MTQRHRPAIVLVMELLKTPPYTPAIAVELLIRRYGELAAVDDLSFSVRPGAVTGLLSPNGAGERAALGLDAARVGEIAHAEGIVLHEFAPCRGSLEDVFLTLTEWEAA
jgi:ABC-type phosphonate transport system ATPase subunit